MDGFVWIFLLIDFWIKRPAKMKIVKVRTAPIIMGTRRFLLLIMVLYFLKERFTRFIPLKKSRRNRKPGSGNYEWIIAITIYPSFWSPKNFSGLPAAYVPENSRFLTLLQMRLAMRRLLPNARWSLTPPFHPCNFSLRVKLRFVFCCAICRTRGYAKNRDATICNCPSSPGNYPAFFPAEPGLCLTVKKCHN